MELVRDRLAGLTLVASPRLWLLTKMARKVPRL
ncbi:MAG: hypothetical protein JWO93_328 [Micrococcaceae bacterium]|nr:hypothetical protein [Micrococcaceae bacterium]